MDGILASLGMLDLFPFDKTGATNKRSLDDFQRITESKEMWVREAREGQTALNDNPTSSARTSRDEKTPPTPVPETLPNSPTSPCPTSLTRTQWTLGNVSDRDASPSPSGMDTETDSRDRMNMDDMEAGKNGSNDNSIVKCQWGVRMRQHGFNSFVRTGDCDKKLSEQTLAQHYLQHAMMQIKTYYTTTCPIKNCEMLLFQRTEDETLEDMILKHNSLMHPTIPSPRHKASTSTRSTTKDVSSKRSSSPGLKDALGVSKPRRQKSRSRTKEPSLTKEIPSTIRRGIVMSKITVETVEDSCDSDGNDLEGMAAKRKASQEHESQSQRRKTRNTLGNDQDTSDLSGLNMESVDTPLVHGPFFTRLTGR